MKPGNHDAAVTSTMESIAPDLLRYFLRRLPSKEDAADCLSETLLVLWRRRRDLPGSAEERRAWAFGAAQRVLLNERRGRLRRSRLADRLRAELVVSATVSPEPDPELDRALAILVEKDRELVVLVAWEGLSVQEAGSLQGLSPEAARKRYSRARVALRAALGTDYARS